MGGWALLQGSVVPGPSDALIVPLGISDPGRVFRLALWAVVGATVGGTIAYLIGAAAFVELGHPLLGVLGVSPARLEASRGAFQRHGWQLVAVSAVSPLPTKAVCVAAGAFGMPLWQFVPAIVVGRALRFFGLALILRTAGPGLLDWLSRRVGVPPVESASSPGLADGTAPGAVAPSCTPSGPGAAGEVAGGGGTGSSAPRNMGAGGV